METFISPSEQTRRNDDDASIHVQNPYSLFINSVRRELDILHSLSDECSIYRVRKRLRELNEKVYTPQVVSIGPLHHGREDLKAMEEHKRRYLNDFLRRTTVSLDDFVKLMKEKEVKLRNCYAESIGLNSDDFVKMILMDAGFIIEVLIRNSLQPQVRRTDRIYSKPWMIFDIKLDMCLLENQLPFFIIKEVFSLANINMPFTLFELAYKFFKDFHLFVTEDLLLLRNNACPTAKHLVDLLRIWHVPFPLRPKTKIQNLTIPSVTELHQAGVKFMLATSNSLFDIRFHDGILEIPKLKIHQPTEFILQNLLAFERCHCDDPYINDCIIIINYLVNTPMDVELLVQNGIIENLMENSEVVSTLFQNLGKSASLNPESFCFSALIKDLNKYCGSRWHRWKAVLKQDYFTTPWAIISVIAAVTLLALTFIQTVCSIISM